MSFFTNYDESFEISLKLESFFENNEDELLLGKLNLIGGDEGLEEEY